MSGNGKLTATARINQTLVFLSSLALILVFLCPGSSFGEGTYNANPKTAQEAIEQLVLANRILANEDIFDYLGHISVRNPENPKTFFIARAIAPETVTKKDVLEVDLDGNIVTKTLLKPYSERIIHAAIFKVRPDVKAVIHAHPVPVVTMSISTVPFKIVAHPASIFYEGVPMYDGYDFTSPNSTGMLVVSKEEGERVAKTLGKSMGMLMRGHGYNIVGESIPHTVRAAISFRDNVVIQLGAQQFGNVKSLSYEEAKAAGLALGSPERGWNAWVSRVKRVKPDMN